MKMYWMLPVFIQETGLSLYARYLDKKYYGPIFDEFKKWLLSNKSSRSEIEEWQRRQLKHILEISALKVPFYQQYWKGIDWKSIESAEGLEQLPTVSKQMIRQNESNFIDNELNMKSLWKEKTSGTTGTALSIYFPLKMLQQRWALTEVMIRYVAGVSQDMPRAMMGGRTIVPGKTDRPPYWRFNRHWNQLYLSSYHVSKKTAIEYVSALRNYKSKWLTGYTSAIAALADCALEAELEPYPLSAVIVSSDTLFPAMRKSIENFFQCKCYDSYGQSEGVAYAQECCHGHMHIVPMFGIIEILGKDDKPCKDGEVGEIVATGLLNDAMPLVRYRTGDYAALDSLQECPCGNPNPSLINLSGRVDDYVVTSDGRKIGRLAAFRRSPSIHSAQLVQDRQDHAYLLVKPGDGYKSLHADAVCNDIKERIGRFDIDIIEVSEIPKNLRGKTPLVIRLDENPTMKDLYMKILSIHE